VALTVEEKGTAVEESFPFGRLRRKRGDEFDLVEVQLNNRKKNAFRVNFAVISEEGIDHVVGHVKAEDVWVHLRLNFQVQHLTEGRVLRWERNTSI